MPLARDASGNPIEKDPEVLFLAANAAYRAGQRANGDRLATVRALDAVVSTYADVIKKSPGHVDAAYNYEYAVRARDAAVLEPGDTARETGWALDAAGCGSEIRSRGTSGRDGRYPAGPTIHGHPGAPPSGTDMKKFKALAPMRPDEREADPDKAGENKRPLRRG